MSWDGEAYQRRFDELRARGVDVHGEARFVLSRSPSSVLDAGCGTGRVAVEMACRGVEVVGVDLDESMLSTARHSGAPVTWVHGDVAGLHLDRTFDVVLMAGNVPLFTAPGTHAALVEGCARHLAPDGELVSGFQLGRGYHLGEFDGHCGAAGLVLHERWATWEGESWSENSPYAVSVHRWAPPG